MAGFSALLGNRASWDTMLGQECCRRNHQVPHSLLVLGSLCGAARWLSSLDGLWDISLYSFSERRERNNNIMTPLCPSADPQQDSLQADLNTLWFWTFSTISV